MAAQALEAMDISLDAVRHEVVEIIGTVGRSKSGSPPFTARSKKVLELSLREALQLQHNYIGTEHILLGIVREGDGVGAQVLERLGATLERTREQVLELIAGHAGPEASGRPMQLMGSSRGVPSDVLAGEPPYCPRCRQSLVDNLRFTTLVATEVSVSDADADADVDGDTLAVVVVFCRSCSGALGTAPTAPS